MSTRLCLCPFSRFRALAAQVLNGAFIKEMSASSLPAEGAAGGVDRQVRNYGPQRLWQLTSSASDLQRPRCSVMPVGGWRDGKVRVVRCRG